MFVAFHLHCTGFPVAGLNTCKTPLGMESGQISDDSITASSQFDPFWLFCCNFPENARLHVNKGAWVPDQSLIDHAQMEWLQIDLRNDTQITGISSQGHPLVSFYFVKFYSLSYSNDGVNFKVYQQGHETKVNYKLRWV